jgi:hypothetical protein
VWKAGVAVSVNDCTLCPPESRHGADKSVFHYASSSYVPRTLGMLRLASCIALQQSVRHLARVLQALATAPVAHIAWLAVVPAFGMPKKGCALSCFHSVLCLLS